MTEASGIRSHGKHLARRSPELDGPESPMGLASVPTPQCDAWGLRQKG